MIRGSRAGRRARGVPAGLAIGLVLVGPARADRIQLSGGGEIRGVVVPDPSKPDLVTIQTEGSPRPLGLPRSQVSGVVREAGPLDDYIRRRAEVAATAPAHYELGLWCDSMKLAGPAEAQYREAIEVDPEYGPAQKKLGRSNHGGKWYTSAELKQAQGMIQHKGKWITPEEKARIDAQAAAAGEQASWARRLKILRHHLLEGTEDQKRQAELQLASIRDPAAVTPLMQALGRDSDPLRLLLGQILGAIPGPEAASALFQRVLAEPDDAIRKATLDEVVRRRERDMISPFSAALGSRDARVVGRAAWALATLNASSAVPRLISALVRTETRMVLVPTVVSGGGGVGFNSFNNGPIGASTGLGAVSGGGGGIGTGHGVGGIGVASGGTVGVITGAAVAPGAVAFGATGVPLFGANGTTLGVGGGPPEVRPMPQLVTTVDPNPEVLRALQSLTGADFGYDVASWRRWVATSFRPTSNVPTRGVPNP